MLLIYRAVAVAARQLSSTLPKCSKNICPFSTRAFPPVVGMGSAAVTTAPRRLVVFDFDQTLVDSDTYTSVLQMAPQRGVPLPTHLRTPPHHEGWPEYMKEVLAFNHSNKIGPADIRQLLETLPMVPGMKELLLYLRANKDSLYDTVIISDANMCFIQWVLEKQGLLDCFSKIFSNPAVVDDKDGLVVGTFHHQTDCPLSPKNMCKGRILQEWMGAQPAPYKAVYYCGDGENDLCPGKRLTSADIFFVRKDFPLAKKLLDSHVKCAVELWSDGHEVLKRLKELAPAPS